MKHGRMKKKLKGKKICTMDGDENEYKDKNMNEYV